MQTYRLMTNRGYNLTGHTQQYPDDRERARIVKSGLTGFGLVAVVLIVLLYKEW